MLFREKYFLREKSTRKLYELGKTFSLGRSTTNDLILENTLVSRVHCKITNQNGCYLIEDLKSKNGVLLNKELLKGRKTLHEGDLLEIPPRGHTFYITSRLYPGPLVLTLLGLLFALTLYFGISQYYNYRQKKKNSLPALLEENRAPTLKQRIKSKLLYYGESEIYITEQVISRIIVYMKQFNRGEKYALYVKGLDKYGQILDSSFSKYGLPADFTVIPAIESNFNPRAYNKKSGARGMWQFMAPTAREMGLIVSAKVDQRLDPVKSTEAAAGHIKNLLANFGKDGILLTAASYNWGGHNMRYALKKIKNLNHHRNFLYINSLKILPKETEEYVLKFVALVVLHELVQEKNTKALTFQ